MAVIDSEFCLKLGVVQFSVVTPEWSEIMDSCNTQGTTVTDIGDKTMSLNIMYRL